MKAYIFFDPFVKICDFRIEADSGLGLTVLDRVGKSDSIKMTVNQPTDMLKTAVNQETNSAIKDMMGFAIPNQ